MNKITKFLIGTLCVLIVLYFLASGYESQTADMASKVGARVGGGELTVSDYYTLAQCMETYQGHLEKGNYETAYNMLGYTYRAYVSLEDYQKSITQDDANKMQLKDINIITPTTYDTLIDISGEETHYSIILNDENNTFGIYPESFLDYKKIDEKISKKKVEYNLKDYIVNIDKCILNLDVKNNNKDNIKITNATLYTNAGEELKYSNTIELQAGEQKSLDLEFATDYTFPEKLVIEYEVEGKVTSIEYSFE